MENVINYLLSQNRFSNHVQAEIQKDLVTLRFDYLDIELRDMFFSLIHIAILNTIDNRINDPGIYMGLIAAYNKMSSDANIEIKVVSEGIYISERRDSYCKFVGDDIVEVPSDESEFFCPVLSAKKFITTNKIASFIDANRGKHNKTSNSA